VQRALFVLTGFPSPALLSFPLVSFCIQFHARISIHPIEVCMVSVSFFRVDLALMRRQTRAKAWPTLQTARCPQARQTASTLLTLRAGGSFAWQTFEVRSGLYCNCVVSVSCPHGHTTTRIDELCVVLPASNVTRVRGASRFEIY
jgi:hypothetical protein